MKQYKVGDEVWWARCGTREVRKPCPICFGDKKVTLTLGNGDEVVLPCDYCGHVLGEEPSGMITEYEYLAEPEPATITRISSEITIAGTEYEYFAGCYRIEDEMLFDTELGAIMKCAEVKEKLEKEQITRAEYIKADKLKSYSWNAGYHLRNAKKDRKSAEYHEKMAILCKDRAKDADQREN